MLRQNSTLIPRKGSVSNAVGKNGHGPQEYGGLGLGHARDTSNLTDNFFSTIGILNNRKISKSSRRENIASLSH